MTTKNLKKNSRRQNERDGRNKYYKIL